MPVELLQRQLFNSLLSVIVAACLYGCSGDLSSALEDSSQIGIDTSIDREDNREWGIEELLEEPTSPSALADDPYIRELEELRQRTGRNNALLHYQMAALLSPADPGASVEQQFRLLREDGVWDADSAVLLDHLRAWEAAFEQIRKGVALNYAEGLDPAILGEDTPLLDVRALLRAARALVAQGKYHESRGEIGNALECYTAVIHLGRDLGGRNATSLAALLGLIFQDLGQSSLRPLIVSGELDDDQLHRTQSFLKRIDETHLGLVEGLRAERTWVRMNADNLIADLEQRTEEELRTAEGFLDRLQVLGQLGDRMATREHHNQHKEEMAAYFDAALETLQLEPYQYDFEEFQERMDALAAGFQHILSGVFTGIRRFETFVSEDVMIARRRLLITQIALERHRLQNERYPDSLDDLRGAFLDELPTDPFSGEPFRYQPSDDRADYTMYSLGPDKIDNPDAGEYDAREGTFSAGVIR